MRLRLPAWPFSIYSFIYQTNVFTSLLVEGPTVDFSKEVDGHSNKVTLQGWQYEKEHLEAVDGTLSTWLPTLVKKHLRLPDVSFRCQP